MSRRNRLISAMVGIAGLMLAPKVNAIDYLAGGMLTPETISVAPNYFANYAGQLFVLDAERNRNDPSVVWRIDSSLTPTAFYTTPSGLTVPNNENGTMVNEDSWYRLVGGTFLPASWGGYGGKYMAIGYQTMNEPSSNHGIMGSSPLAVVIDEAGNGTAYNFATPVGAAVQHTGPQYGDDYFLKSTTFYNGQFLVTDAYHGVRAINSSMDFSTFSTLPGVALTSSNTAFGICNNPYGEGVLVSTTGNSIYQVKDNGATSLFATIPLLTGQVGLRQMAVAPQGFFSYLGLYGQYVVVSVAGSSNGGGSLGSLLVVDEFGNVVAHLKTGDITNGKFDPRGVTYVPADANFGGGVNLTSVAGPGYKMLVADSSDPIYVAFDTDFDLGPDSLHVPEPGVIVMLCSGAAALSLSLRRRTRG